MGKNEVKVIFFDIGGVLLTNGWGHESRQLAAERFGLNFNEMDVLHDFIFNVYEIGKISLDDYLHTTVFNHPRNFSAQEFKDFMFEQSKELPYMREWLADWRYKNRDFTIIAINNEGKELNDYRINKFKLHKCFDAFISSCEVGMRKPDPEIFRLGLGIAQVAPEQSVYFDDRVMLSEAAGKLGINAYHHQGFESTKKILEEIKRGKIPG